MPVTLHDQDVLTKIATAVLKQGELRLTASSEFVGAETGIHHGALHVGVDDDIGTYQILDSNGEGIVELSFFMGGKIKKRTDKELDAEFERMRQEQEKREQESGCPWAGIKDSDPRIRYYTDEEAKHHITAVKARGKERK